MAVHLLDVNVLLALFDPWHALYKPAQAWFRDNKQAGWATCPLTENGFIRISSHPRYPERPGQANEVAQRLDLLCQDSYHRFWPDDARISDLVRTGMVFTHSQVTDLYLLGLAVRHGGRLATLDRGIPATLVAGGKDALTLIPV